MSIKTYFSLSFFFVLLCFGANAQEKELYSLSTDSLVNKHASNKRVYFATRTTNRPKIDGKLSDQCWNEGLWSGDFIQQLPLQGREPSQKTQVKLLYDDANLYVAMRCFDNQPQGIRPVLTRRDELGGDLAGIAIDSYNDKRTAFEFDVTAAGQKVDFVHLGSFEYDTNWDAVWYGKSSIGDSIWTSEMRIPFNQLRFAKKDEQVWGFHAWRWIDRLNEENHWKLIPVDAPAAVYLFGELRGIKGVKPKTNFEFLPFTTMKYSPNTDLKDKTNYGFGLDGKIGLTSDFTLDYTINPDFGQIEADPSILNLNAYEVFYDEKRPFFLEGNSMLNFAAGGDILFYSRRIGHAPTITPNLDENETLSMPENTSIINALKLTGKSKKGLSLGLVQSFTAKEQASIYSGNDKTNITVEPFSSYLVGSLKQDFNKGNTVLGGMVTSVIRNIDDPDIETKLTKSAFTGGLEFTHNWKKRKYFIDVKSIYSNVTGNEAAITKLQKSSTHFFQRIDATHLELDPTRTSLSGFGGNISGGKRSGKFRATGYFRWRSPGVDLNDIGYMQQADFINEGAQFIYKVNKPRWILREYSAEFYQEHNWSYGGENTNDLFNWHIYTRFKNLWLLRFDLKWNFNTFDTKELWGGPKLFKEASLDRLWFLQTNSAKDLQMVLSTSRETRADSKTRLQDYRLYLRWQIGKNFKLVSDTRLYNINDYHEYSGKAYSDDNSMSYMVGMLERKVLETTFRAEYFITPELSVQYYASPYATTGQYSEFRKVVDGSNRNINLRYAPVNTITLEDGYYYADENADGNPDIYFRNPDFNFQELRSNFVARWEFRPGSTLYMVWAHTRSDYESKYNDSIFDSFRGIFDVKAQNVFMLKFNYWFSL